MYIIFKRKEFEKSFVNFGFKYVIKFSKMIFDIVLTSCYHLGRAKEAKIGPRFINIFMKSEIMHKALQNVKLIRNINLGHYTEAILCHLWTFAGMQKFLILTAFVLFCFSNWTKARCRCWVSFRFMSIDYGFH